MTRPGLQTDVPPGQASTSLADLHDIVLPERVPFWPPAPGWWVLGAVLLAAVALAVWIAVRRWRAAAYRRAALGELVRLEEVARADGERAAALAALAGVLKRTALAAYPRPRVAPLSGAAWLAFLDRTGRTDAFTAGAGRALAELAYDPAVARDLGPSEAGALFACARDWVRRHTAEEPAC